MAAVRRYGPPVGAEKLFDLTRGHEVRRRVTEADAQLELGLDIAGFEMPGMIAVPIDLEHPLNGDCEWVPTTEATVADLDANLRMLDLQITADQHKRRNIALLRQRVVSIVGENSRRTVAQAAAMAREMQNV